MGGIRRAVAFGVLRHHSGPRWSVEACEDFLTIGSAALTNEHDCFLSYFFFRHHHCPSSAFAFGSGINRVGG